MLFAQLTDMHITTQNPSPFAGRCSSLQLKKIIQYLNAFPQTIEFVLLTGDCVHLGTKEEYILLRNLLNELRLPYFLIPGNHDERSQMRAIFPELNILSEDPVFIHYALEDYPVRFIALDSVKEKATPGEMCDKRLLWLENTLNKDKSKPTLIFLHHPPLRTGIRILDHSGFPEPEKLSDVLRNHPQVKHILCGHFHRPMQGIWGGIPVTAVGSTVAQFSPDFSSVNPAKWSDEPPAFALHWWNTSLVTQFCNVPVTL